MQKIRVYITSLLWKHWLSINILLIYGPYSSVTKKKKQKIKNKIKQQMLRIAQWICDADFTMVTDAEYVWWIARHGH